MITGAQCKELAQGVTVFFFLLGLNKFDEYNVSSQATAWVKK